MGVAPDRQVSGGDIADPTLIAGLRNLTVEHRAVLVLPYDMDWSMEDIADALAVPIGTVKSRQHWALKRLREELGDDG